MPEFSFPRTLATTNAKKIDEWNAILRELVPDDAPTVTMLSQQETFLEIQNFDPVEVAITKALDAYKRCGSVLVEDVAFCIEALGGFPGILYGPVEQKIGRKGLLKLMEGEKNRRVCAMTTIAYVPKWSLKVHVVKGELWGMVTEKERGSNGLGFDFIMQPDGHKLTLAEMTPEEKNDLSMRRRAIERLLEGHYHSFPASNSPLWRYIA